MSGLPTLKLRKPRQNPSRLVKAAKIGVNVWEGRRPGSPTGVFGVFFRARVKRFQAAHGIPASGVVGPKTWKALLPFVKRAGAEGLLEPPPSLLLLVNPIPRSAKRYSVCQGLHATAGLPGNWAVDFCVAPRTPVLAAEAGTVTKLSGHPPNEDTWDKLGVFGWTVYVTTADGYRYFVTHLGSRSVKVGQKVVAGSRLGTVGDQRFRPDHVHYGVTSPRGSADAKRRITAVKDATRVL